MSVSVEQNMTEMSNSLSQARQEIINKRDELFYEFWRYAYTKFTETEAPFKVSYSLINGLENINFEDLNIGDSVHLELVTFTYVPLTATIEDYIKKEYTGIKHTDDFLDNIHISGKGINKQSYSSYPKDTLSSLDLKKLEEAKQAKIKSILNQIFNRELVFEDAEFKRLDITNQAIQRELERLEVRIEALNKDKNK